MDNKITVSRGYTRKINLGNYIKSKPYESIDVFANYSEEVPADTSKTEIKKLSKELFDRARWDVDDSASQVLMEEINNIPRKSNNNKIKNTYHAETEIQAEAEADGYVPER